MKCNNIKSFREALNNEGWKTEEKPSGQIKHSLEDCVCNTYDTGTVVIQDNSETKEYTRILEKLVETLNNLSSAA